MVSKLGRFYLWFWFHTEFWLTPVDRRPYTFMMRDWIYRHVTTSIILITIYYVCIIVLSIWHGTASTITSSLASFLLAHLVWGSKWIEGQQESPDFLG